MYVSIPLLVRGEDLWETRVKRPYVFKCLGAYKSIS